MRHVLLCWLKLANLFGEIKKPGYKQNIGLLLPHLTQGLPLQKQQLDPIYNICEAFIGCELNGIITGHEPA